VRRGIGTAFRSIHALTSCDPFKLYPRAAAKSRAGLVNLELKWVKAGAQIHRLILLYAITSEDWAGFLITIKASDARLPKSRGMRRTRWYAAVTRDEGNAADDVLMVDQGEQADLTG
jgi:hypothetical protein